MAADGRRPRVPLLAGPAPTPLPPPPPLFVAPLPADLRLPSGAWAPSSAPFSFRHRPVLAAAARPATSRTRTDLSRLSRTPRPAVRGVGGRRGYRNDGDRDVDGDGDVGERYGRYGGDGWGARTRSASNVVLSAAASVPGAPPPKLVDDGWRRDLTGGEVTFPPYVVNASFTREEALVYSQVTKLLVRGDLQGATAEVIVAAATAPLVLVIRVVRQLRQGSLLSEALRVIDAVDAAGRRGEFERRLYSELFVLLARLGRGERLCREWAALEPGTMAHLGALAFRTVLLFFCKQNLLNEAIFVKAAMRDAGYTLARGGYNMFLDACARSRRLPEAFEGLAEMAESGVTPDVVTFNTLLNVCVRTEQLDMAFQLLDKMRSWGIEADNFTWNVLINGCRRQGLLRKAFALADEMEAQSQRSNNGGVTGPDLVTYNTLLAGCARDGDADRAMQVKARLEAKGFQGNATTYNSLMTACSRASRLEDAFAIFDEMVAKGLQPNRELFCTLINACARSQMVDRAVSVHALMSKGGIAPTCITYNALLNAHRVVGDVDGALAVLEDMRVNGVAPDVVTYSAVVDTLGRTCRVNDAFAIVDEMRAAGVEPNLVTYTSLVAGCVRTGDMTRAEEVFEAIVAARLKPNVYTYSALVHGYGRQGQLGKALGLLGEMRSVGICPTVTTYAALVQVVGRRADEAGLASVLAEMRADAVLWDPKIVEALLSVKTPFLEAGKPEVCDEVDVVVAALVTDGVKAGGAADAEHQKAQDIEDVAPLTRVRQR